MKVKIAGARKAPANIKLKVFSETLETSVNHKTYSRRPTRSFRGLLKLVTR